MAKSQRLQRQRARQEARTRRQKTRQEARTRRQTARQKTRQERIKQKGASGYYSPAGIQARGQVASGLIGQGTQIAGMFGTGGMSSLVSGGSLPSLGANLQSSFVDALGDRREQASEMLDFFDSPLSSSLGGGGVGGFLEDITQKKEEPFYTKPLFIGGALVGAYLLLRRRR